MADLSRLKLDPEVVSATYSKINSLCQEACSTLQHISQIQISEYAGEDAKAYCDGIRKAGLTLKTKLEEFNNNYVDLGKKDINNILEVESDITASAKRMTSELSE